MDITKLKQVLDLMATYQVDMIEIKDEVKIVKTRHSDPDDKSENRTQTDEELLFYSAEA